MGTKNEPGEFDCYAAAKPDEPMFILLGRDPAAPLLVSLWTALRAAMGDTEEDKLLEARATSESMVAYLRREGREERFKKAQWAMRRILFDARNQGSGIVVIPGGKL